MNNIKKIAALACIALMGGMSACTDGNDWDADGSYAGTFRPTSLSCEQTGKGETTVMFTFGSVPGATSYQIEAATDTITADEVNPDNIVAEVTKSPATVDGFKMETTYWTRIRAISPSGNSKWIAAKKFTTEAINVINSDLTETTMTSVTVRWTGGTVLTKATVEKQEELVREIEPTEEQKAAGEMKITELQPATIYTIKLWNGENRVGMVSVITQSGGPTGDYNITFDPASTMGEQLADVAAKAAEDGNDEYTVTVIIPAGVEAKIADKPAEGSSDEASALTLPDGMSVTFYGERGNAMDVVTIYKSLNLDGRHSVVKFQNLTVTGAGYLLNQSNVCAVDSLIIEDCKVSGFTGNTFIRTQGGSYEKTNAIGCLKLANSTFDNCGKGYGFIHVDGTIINNIDIDGCTFSNICTTGKCFFMQSKYVQGIESMRIKNSTFYNYCGNAQYFIDFKDKSVGPETFELSNCIFGKTADETTNKNVRGTCDVADHTSNCKLLSDCFKVIKGADKLEDKSSADIFTDPDNGDFTLKTGCGIEKCGDPRWY
ncbi:MAG: DUF5123 domain-containing protein [Bacteroidales bacterium]|nr:DUF5123 domain-containing protein [Bacteroidales bacterium]